MKKLLIVFMVLGLVSPAMAADWNFYGSARMSTFYTTEDVGDLEDDGRGYDDADLAHKLQGNARFGAKVKASDQIGGAFEYGTSGGAANIRKIYGTYNFGGGELLVGQTYTPTSDIFYSNQVYGTDNDLLGLGQFYLGRKGMIQLKMGGFKVALVDPTPGLKSLGSYNDVDITLPRIEASYNLKSDAFFMDVFAGFLTYDLEDNAEDESEGITAYTVGIGGGVMFGPLTLSAAINYGLNYGAYGALVGFEGRSVSMESDEISISELANPHMVNGDIEDTTAMQAMLVANFKLSDTLALEGGVGFSNLSNDEAFDDEDYTQMVYYFNAVVTFAPGFFIVPEVGYIDYGDDLDGKTDLGNDIYAGLKWQINF